MPDRGLLSIPHQVVARATRRSRINSRRRLRRVKRAVARFLYRADVRLIRARGSLRGPWLRRAAAVVVFSAMSAAAYFFAFRSIDFSTNGSIAQALFQQIASGLIGTSVVCVSLITFFLQNNLSRLPHSLFQRFSSDPLILAYFLLSFGTAVTSGLLSLYVTPTNGAELTLLFLALCGCVLAMLLLSFVRALELVNPTFQLRTLVRTQRANARWWSRRAELARAVVRTPVRARDDRFDYAKHTFFSAQAQWAAGLETAVRHCTAFIRQFSAVSDYGVTQLAFRSMVDLNAAYIQARGATFFASNPFLQTGLSTDALINETLEQVRQLHGAALVRRDETLIEQCYDAYVALSAAYYAIAYGREHAEKTHCRLALGYFGHDVQRALPLKLPDVALHAVRRLGGAGLSLAQSEDSGGVRLVVEELAKIAPSGIALPEYQPVTSVVTDQLASLLLAVLVSRSHRLHHLDTKITEALFSTAHLYLTVKSPETNDVMSQRPETFFNLTNMGSFSTGLTRVANQILSLDKQTDESIAIVHNIAHWSEHLFRHVKDVFVLALQKKSHLVFDISHWVEEVARILLALASADVPSRNSPASLERNAEALVWALSWYPKDETSVRTLEHVFLTEVLFDIGREAALRRQWRAFEATLRVFLGWGAAGAEFGAGWGTLESVLFGTAALLSIAEKQGGALNVPAILAKERPYGLKVPRDRLSDAEQAIANYKSGHDRDHSSTSLGAEVARADRQLMVRYLDLIVTTWAR